MLLKYNTITNKIHFNCKNSNPLITSEFNDSIGRFAQKHSRRLGSSISSFEASGGRLN
ncbi:hypothetical protein Sjap_018339 [Stephania japonica]|uniref:Uncharacterized protein n=1 Tax=Stephania japonica TaxID=461633 RepID=A0AAP0I7T5_9MAGN